MTTLQPKNARLTFTQELISPETAAKMLGLQRGNRKLQNPRVKELSRQMVRGDWKDNSSEIRFNINGELIDGQHRLNAVIHSNTCQYFVVIRGYELGEYIFDSGKSRSTHDVVTMSLGTTVKKANVDAVKYAALLPKNLDMKLTDAEVAELYDSYEEGAVFVGKKSGASKKNYEIGLIAPVMGLLLKAYEYESRADLKEFINIFKTGVASETIGNPAIAFRRDFLSYKTKYTKKAGMAECYYKAQKALKAFVEGKKLDKITLSPKDKSDRYPLTSNW